jgi:hypothetical protein
MILVVCWSIDLMRTVAHHGPTETHATGHMIAGAGETVAAPD